MKGRVEPFEAFHLSPRLQRTDLRSFTRSLDEELRDTTAFKPWRASFFLLPIMTSVQAVDKVTLIGDGLEVELTSAVAYQSPKIKRMTEVFKSKKIKVLLSAERLKVLTEVLKRADNTSELLDYANTLEIMQLVTLLNDAVAFELAKKIRTPLYMALGPKLVGAKPYIKEIVRVELSTKLRSEIYDTFLLWYPELEWYK